MEYGNANHTGDMVIAFNGEIGCGDCYFVTESILGGCYCVKTRTKTFIQVLIIILIFLIKLDY
jgi:hypothetical protein